MKRRLFLQRLLATTAVGIITPSYLLKGRSIITVPSFTTAGPMNCTEASMLEMYANTGYTPNTLIMGQKVFEKMRIVELTGWWDSTMVEKYGPAGGVNGL